MSVTSIYVYPIKACQGVTVSQARLSENGYLEHDREFCVVDASGMRYPERQSLSQRACPYLASIGVEMGSDGLTLTAPGMPKLQVAWNPPLDARDVVVECGGASTTSPGSWHLGRLPGKDMGLESSQWLSEHLNRIDQGKRKKDPARFLLVKASRARALSTYAGPTQAPFDTDIASQAEGKGSPFRMQDVPVGPKDKWLFADVAPLNVASEASFEELQTKLARLQNPPSGEEIEGYSVKAFRPNVVVAGKGLKPFSEETWKLFSIGGTPCRLLKPCPRCSVPARHWLTGEFYFSGKSKLKPQGALRQFWPEKCIDSEWEEEWQGPMFSVHVAPDLDPKALKDGGVWLRVGDDVRVHDLKPASSAWGGYRGVAGLAVAVLLLAWVLFANNDHAAAKRIGIPFF